jgi:aminoglycoside phosphotransferase (APT) family kinase protein
MNSQLVARRIAAALCGEATRVEALPGRRNPVFRLRSACSSRILKLAGSSDSGLVAKEQWLTLLLAERGVPVAAIEAADCDGAQFGCPFLLMQSAGEETVAHWLTRPGEVRGVLLGEMGFALGQIHEVTFPSAGDLAPDGVTPADPSVFMGKIHQVAAFLASQGLLPKQDARRFMALELPLGHGTSLCHSDFRAEQCVVDREHVAAVVDWESAWAGDPFVDLAIAHAHLELTGSAALAGQFLAGYGEVRSLPRDYEPRYLQVRMACLLGLIRVWATQGGQSWAHALRHHRVSRALELFRGHLARVPE